MKHHLRYEFANESLAYPYWKVENVLLEVDKFVFPLDFVIMDMKDNNIAPLLPG